jgi:hypothetical protein
MAERFGVPQVLAYLAHMGIRVARIDDEQEFIELAFYGEHGKWRMIVGFQQNGEARKLMFLIPQFGTVEKEQRLACLEALMSVNYRIALGKFGMDIGDGEIRLEEVIPIADQGMSIEQFQLAFGSLLQVAVIYQKLLSHITVDQLPIEEALEVCEQEFVEITGEAEDVLNQEQTKDEDAPELNLDEVMEEVNRLLENPKE